MATESYNHGKASAAVLLTKVKAHKTYVDPKYRLL